MRRFGRLDAFLYGRQNQVEKRFEEKDLFDADIHEASVATLFLLSSVNLKLRPSSCTT